MFLKVSSRCQQLLFSKHSNSLLRSLRISRYFHDNPNSYSRSSVQAVLNCYEKRNYVQVFEPAESTSLVETDIDPAVHHVVIRARPDEFHKLPPKCSACGAILQTKIETEAGYINEKKFLESLEKNTIHKVACYSCFRLRHHNDEASLIKGISSNDAMNQLQHLKPHYALILYVVDLFDIEGTMMSNILQLIGPKKRLIIVGNKLDRIPIDTERHLVGKQVESLKNSLKDIAFKNGLENSNLKDICLISAKSGYGIKNLVDTVRAHRDPHMNVFLVGCTNTGKSTLYNLLANLLNVHKNNDLPPQAIEHHMPGTTNSFLRELISSSKLLKLTRRLNEEPYEDDKVFNFDDEFLNFLNADKNNPKYKLMKTYKSESSTKLLNASSAMERRPLEFVDDKKKEKVKDACFIYDTPGIFNPSQLIQFLTPKEISYLSPTLWVVPRTVMLVPGYSLCVGGIARLNYLEISKAPREPGFEDKDDSYNEIHNSNKGIYVTAMVSPNVPLHVTQTEIAEEKYETWFSNDFLKLPSGSPERLKEFPKLKEHEYTILGKGRNENASDLVLHGIGWLSVASVWASKVSLALYTPNGEGQNLRRVPLLPFSVRRKSSRGVKYNGRINYRMYNHTRKKSPQLIAMLEEKYNTVDTTKVWKKKINEKMVQQRFDNRETKRLERLEAGVVLGRKKELLKSEQKYRLLSEEKFAKQLEASK